MDAGRVLTLIGALCYAELASTFPNAGGDYHFLTRAYGRDISFFFAWARVAVITTGSIALLAFVFGDYMSRVVSLGPNSSAIYAAITVIVLTALNIIGLRESSRAQNVLTILEVTGLLLVTLAGFWQPRPPQRRRRRNELRCACTLRIGNGVCVADVRRMERGRIYIRRSQRRPASYRAPWFWRSVHYRCLPGVCPCRLDGLGLAGMKESKAVGARRHASRFGPSGAQLIGVIVGLRP